MILIIKEYLSMLKESKELDALLPDLLLSMGITPISKPQVGPRQYGVDIPAVGKIEGINALCLFAIKKGDITRTNWDDGTPQAIRRTLNDIKDVYIPKLIPQKYKDLPIKIILTTGGDIKQNVKISWDGYIEDNTTKNLNFDFWGGDELSLLILKHMFNENIFPDSIKKMLRKSLALVGEVDYDARDFFNLIDELLKKIDPGGKTPSTKKIINIFRTVNLCLNILFYWAQEENNLKPAYVTAERVLLKTWNYIHENKLFTEKILFSYVNAYRSFTIIFYEYYRKVRDHFHIEGALYTYCTDSSNFCLLIFEQIGMISTIGLIQFIKYVNSKEERFEKDTNEVTHTLKNIINKYGITSTPFYDGHMIDIGLALLLLYHTGNIEFIKDWILNLVRNIAHAYIYKGKYFPIDSDDFNTLLELNEEESINKTELMRMSTLLPMLAEWCVVIDAHDIYNEIVQFKREFIKETCLQLWFPEQESIDMFYKQNATIHAGASLAPILLPDTIEELKRNIKIVSENTLGHAALSSFQSGIIGLEYIVHRHYRTPIFPSQWQKLIKFDE